MDVCYYAWFPLLAMVAAYFLTHRNRRKRDHYLASFLGIWMVGVVIAVAVTWLTAQLPAGQNHTRRLVGG